MIAKILSRLFQAGFWILLLVSIASLYAKVMEEPIVIQKDKHSAIILARPELGIDVRQYVAAVAPKQADAAKQRASVEGSSVTQQWISPEGTGKKLLFLIYDAVWRAAYLLLFLALASILANFSTREYFTLPNVHLMRNTGIYLLVAQLAHLAMYVGFIRPNNVAALSNIPGLVQFEALTGVSDMLVIVACGLLVVSYLLKDGLVKEATVI